MINSGPMDKGFMVCKDCGAAMPGEDIKSLDKLKRPYQTDFARSKCNHTNAMNVTTVLFDNDYELLHDRIDIRAVSPITERIPRRKVDVRHHHGRRGKRQSGVFL